jgi:S-(hydroxymethyl)glutathione dehydrogenase / alcohol dehydrogenase
LAQRVDQLRAHERLRRDRLRDGESCAELKTRAALFRAVGQPFEVVEVDLREPGPEEVVVAMTAVGICGTDLHQVKGEFQRPTPMVLGHEGAGVVERVGSAVAGLKPGDEVVLSWAPSCGVCGDCRRGRPAACSPLHAAIGAGTLVDGTTGISYEGETVYRGTATGAWAERVVVAAKAALPTGGSIPLREAALLGCAALTGVGSVLFLARVTPGSSVLVLGGGGVGQFLVQGARIAGAATIVCADPIESRRAQALELGATHAFDPGELEAELRRLAPEGADYAFDAVGYPATSVTALELTRSGGTCVIVGLPPTGSRLDLDPALFTRREKWLTGTMYGSEDPAVALPVLIGHVRAGRLDLASLVGPSYPLDEVNAAVEASLAGSPGRVLVTP